MDHWLIITIVIIVVGLLLLLWLLSAALTGAVLLFSYAELQGFIGIAVYFAMWVFLFPVMLVASIGWYSRWDYRLGSTTRATCCG